MGSGMVALADRRVTPGRAAGLVPSDEEAAQAAIKDAAT
jgi:hypothetical protein